MKFAPFAIAGVFFVYLLGQLYSHNVLFALPADADETYFEAIAFNISKGKGFSGEFSEDFVKPYLELYGEHYLDSYISEIHSLGINSTTTYRPPLFPGMLGVLYYLFGRQLILAKILNAGLL